MSSFFIGRDLGQSRDYTALVVLELVPVNGEKPLHHLRYLERFPLGTPYPIVIAHVKELLAKDALKGCNRLVVDATGVGTPVVDLLRQGGLSPVAVTITGGEAVNHEGNSWRVPKRDLVSIMQVLLQTGRLKLAEGLPEAQTLIDELLDFRVRISDTGHDSYGTWREGAHDDLVLATALACWYGERYGSGAKILSERQPSRWAEAGSIAWKPNHRPWHEF